MVVFISVFAIVTSLAAFAIPLSVNEKRTVDQIKTDVTALGTDIVRRSLNEDMNIMTYYHFP